MHWFCHVFPRFFRLKHPFRYAKHTHQKKGFAWKSTVLDTVSRCWLRLRLQQPCFLGTSFLIGSFTWEIRGLTVSCQKGRCQERFVFFSPAISRYVQPATSTDSQLTWFQALLGVLKGCTAHEVGKWLIGIRIWVFDFWSRFLHFLLSFQDLLIFFRFSACHLVKFHVLKLHYFDVCHLVTSHLMVSFNISDW